MLKQGKYSQEEVEYILAHYQTKQYKEIAADLNRSKHSVQKKAEQLKLKKMELRRWSDEEDAYLLQAYADRRQMTAVAEELGRLLSEVSTRARRLGIRRWKTFRPYVNNGGYLVIGYTKKGDKPSNCQIVEHRFVFEQHLGRQLEDGEIIHHINGVKLDNRIENLALMSSVAQHRACHVSVESLLSLYVGAGLISLNQDTMLYEPTPKLLDMQPASETN